jgi:hypothetical protein
VTEPRTTEHTGYSRRLHDEAGLLGHLAPNGCHRRLARLDTAGRQSPSAIVRAADEQDARVLVAHDGGNARQEQ